MVSLLLFGKINRLIFFNFQIESMKFIVRLFITAAIAYGLSMILSGVHIANYTTALLFAFVLALLDTFVKPLLILLTLPITILTLGLFLFVVNTLVIIIADKFIDGIKIDGFFWALIFSLVLSIFSSAANTAMKEEKNKK
jgi:putative membrane protein